MKMLHASVTRFPKVRYAPRGTPLYLIVWPDGRGVASLAPMKYTGWPTSTGSPVVAIDIKLMQSQSQSQSSAPCNSVVWGEMRAKA